MDDSVFLSLELDPLMIDSISGGLSYIEQGSTVTENTRDSSFDQTFYVVTSDNFTISSQTNPSIAGNSLNFATVHDFDQTINYISLEQPDAENSFADVNVTTGSNVDHTIEYVETDPEAKTKFNHSDQPRNQNSFSKKIHSLHKTGEYFDKEVGSHKDGEFKNYENIWKCDSCPEMRFPSKRQLQRHSASRHPPAPRRLPCPDCAVTFPLAFRLKSHMLAVHSHYRPHKCEECGKAFYKAFDLKKHKSTHNGIKPHKCITCSKTFADASNLKRHMLLHSFEKPHKCETCGKRYQQLASLRRHQTESAAALLGLCGGNNRAAREYHCKICGDKFQFKSSLMEHVVRAHENNTGSHLKISQISDLGRNVDALINDILFEDTEQRPSQYTIEDKIAEKPVIMKKEQLQADAENSFEIELINEIHKIEGLASEPQSSSTDNAGNAVEEFQIRSELFSENIDSPMNFNNFHSQSFNLQTNNINFDSIPIANNVTTHNKMTATETSQSEHLNFENINIEKLPDELLNFHHGVESEIATELENSDFEPQEVAVNECATIFESDVDLESSTNLAANLNQLIAENTVQFVSTEDDDTFIINLNSTIDAEQLSDLLNIGIEIVDQSPLNVSISSSVAQNMDNKHLVENIKECIIPSQEKRENKKKRVKKKSPLFTCKICSKTFTKKDNYYSHIGTHNPKLARHKCELCKRRFSYLSTLNKHRRAAHEPRVWPSHSCTQCPKHYRAAWMLKCHLERDHEKLFLYRCTKSSCKKEFYKKSDFDYHLRLHSQVWPYKCVLCDRGFTHPSHLARHRRKVNCTRPKVKKGRASKTTAGEGDASTELLTDIDDLLKSKMSVISPLCDLTADTNITMAVL